MQEITQNVHWWGVIGGAVVAFLAGWIWYSPKVMGQRWADGAGVDLTRKPPLDGMVAQILGLFLMSWFVGVTATDQALLTVVLATIAAIVLSYSRRAFIGHGMATRLIDAGFVVIALILMVFAQGIALTFFP